MKKLLNAVRGLFADKETLAAVQELKDEVTRLRADLAGLDRAVTAAKPLDGDALRGKVLDILEDEEVIRKDEIPQAVRDEMADYEVDEDRVRSICDDWKYDNDIPDEERVGEMVRDEMEEFATYDQVEDKVREFCEGEEFMCEEGVRHLIQDYLAQERTRNEDEAANAEEKFAAFNGRMADLCEQLAKAETKVRVLVAALRCVNEVTE